MIFNTKYYIEKEKMVINKYYEILIYQDVISYDVNLHSTLKIF